MMRELTCIICPVGCGLKAEINGGEITVTGNSCPRGAAYAKSECVFPMRIVTTTVRCDDGSVLSVKTDRPIPKDKVFECMKIINSSTARLPIAAGDVIIKGVFGCNVVATQNRR